MVRKESEIKTKDQICDILTELKGYFEYIYERLGELNSICSLRWIVYKRSNILKIIKWGNWLKSDTNKK